MRKRGGLVLVCRMSSLKETLNINCLLELHMVPKNHFDHTSLSLTDPDNFLQNSKFKDGRTVTE